MQSKKEKYEPKRRQPEDVRFVRSIVPSLIGIAACIICLIGLTIVWVTANISSGTVQSWGAGQGAEAFHVTVSIVPIASDEAVLKDDGGYELAAGAYIITLTSEDVSKTGYCTIKIGENQYQSAPMSGEAPSLTFTLVLNSEGAEIFFVPVTGEGQESKNLIANGDMITIGEADTPDHGDEFNNFPAVTDPVESAAVDPSRDPVKASGAPGQESTPPRDETTAPPASSTPSQNEKPETSSAPVTDPPVESVPPSQSPSVEDTQPPESDPGDDDEPSPSPIDSEEPQPTDSGAGEEPAPSQDDGGGNMTDPPIEDGQTED